MDRQLTETERIAKRRNLAKLPKSVLVQMVIQNGGLMGRATYMKWRKEELINSILGW